MGKRMRDEGKGVKEREKETIFEIEKFELKNEREILRKILTIKQRMREHGRESVFEKERERKREHMRER